MYQIKRHEQEIDNVLNSAAAWEERGGTQYRGMTYEQGVAAGIRWMTGETEEHPIPEEPEEQE